MNEVTELDWIKLADPLKTPLLNLVLWFVFRVLTLVLCAKVWVGRVNAANNTATTGRNVRAFMVGPRCHASCPGQW